MKPKSKQEKLFLLVVVAMMSLLVLCLTGCSGSCLGCSFNCESEDDSYSLGGISYVSEGCCSSTSCKTASGCVDTGDEEAELSNMVSSSCTHTYDGGCNGSTCYNGCFVGKGVDCGDCGIVCGTVNDDSEVTENTIGCVDGCVGCEKTDGQMGWLYELIYALLGI